MKENYRIQTHPLSKLTCLLLATSIGVIHVSAAAKKGEPEAAPLSDAGNKLQSKYTELLASLRAEIVKSLPKMDEQALTAFSKAYAEEAVARSAYEASLKGKAHIGADAQAKEDAAKAVRDIADAYTASQSNTISAAKPILAKLDKLLSSEILDSNLIKCAVLTEATPAGLAKFAAQGPEQEALITKLLGDNDLMKQMLVAGGAKDGNYGKAIQIYAQIRKASQRADRDVLQRLAVGTSLEQAGPGRLTEGKIDPVVRYLHYEKAYMNGELDPAFKNMTTWECRMITDAPESEDDLAWCREMMRNYRPDHILEPDYRWRYSKIVKTDVPYKSPETSDDGTSRIQQLIAGGGKCGPRAFVGRFALRAFGIPTWGVTQPGHAAVAHWTPEGWTINLGAGWPFSWWGDRPGTDFYRESQARAFPNDFMKSLRAQWIGNAFGEQRVNPAKPGSGDPWNALALTQQKAIVAEGKPRAVALAGEDLAEATESKSTKAEVVASSKITETDKKIITGQNGEITIPAAACSKPTNNTKNITFMKSFSGGAQMSQQKDEAFEYTFDAPSAGNYALTAKVVTVHKDLQLMVAPNDSKAPVAIAVPYTLGKWQETAPVEVPLVKGRNVLHFTRDASNYSLTIKQFTLKKK